MVSSIWRFISCKNNSWDFQKCPLYGGFHYTEVSTIQRFNCSKNRSVGPRSVRNTELPTKGGFTVLGKRSCLRKRTENCYLIDAVELPRKLTGMKILLQTSEFSLELLFLFKKFVDIDIIQFRHFRN